MTFFFFPVNNPESGIRFPQSTELFRLGNKADEGEKLPCFSGSADLCCLVFLGGRSPWEHKQSQWHRLHMFDSEMT